MKTKNLLKKAFLLLALMGGASNAWGNQTDLISGVTLPDIPGSTLDLSSQADYSADAYGWIVETSPKANIGSKTWHSKLATDGGETTWTVPVGTTAPFVSSTDDAKLNRYTVRSGARTHAIRFTGAEKASFLVSRNSDTRKTVVAVFSYVGTTQTLIDSKSMASGSIGELLFEGLTSSVNYIAYIYGSDASNNSDWYEFALKAPVTTYTVTYKAGAGTGDNVVDDNAAVVADCPNTFTAPSGKSFCGWNTESNGSGTPYAVGATVTSNLTLFAQWSASHSVTYSLGAATGGTVPTQDDVAEGATFDVAAVPGDLVPPSGKEFKCWNDGTSDYDPGANYTMSTSDVVLTAVYQDRTFDGLTPTSTLDLSDASSTTFTTIWFDNSGKMDKNYYYDAPNGRVVMSAYAIYQGKNQEKVAWMATDSGNSSACTWDATGVFKGNAYYFNDDSRAASIQQTARIHYYRVTNCTGVSALTNGKSYMAAYEVNAGVVSPDPADGKTSTISDAGTLSITGLDKDKEYVILVRGNNGTSGIRFYEIAFNFPPVASTNITPANAWSTYVTPYALDFSNVAGGLKAYVATAAAGGVVTLDEVGAVPAGTPLMLVGTATTEYTVPVVASASAPAVNMFRAGDGTTVFNGSTFDYILYTDGKFYQIGSGTVATNKAYLHCTSDPTTPLARELRISFGDNITGIEQIDNGQLTIDNSQDGKFIENGKLVIVKNGQKFNAAGALIY